MSGFVDTGSGASGWGRVGTVGGYLLGSVFRLAHCGARGGVTSQICLGGEDFGSIIEAGLGAKGAIRSQCLSSMFVCVGSAEDSSE